MRFALLFKGIYYILIWCVILSSVHCGKLKDAYKVYKKDDIHSQCISLDKLQEAQAERDACRHRLGEIFTKNAELEIYIEELQQTLEAREAEIVSIRNEMSIRIALVENRLHRYTSQTHAETIPPPLHILQGQRSHHAPPVPALNRPSHAQFHQNMDPPAPRMPVPRQAPQAQEVPLQHTPRMISSESPAFQRMVRANKSYNDLRRRQQRQQGGGGSGGGQI